MQLTTPNPPDDASGYEIIQDPRNYDTNVILSGDEDADMAHQVHFDDILQAPEEYLKAQE